MRICLTCSPGGHLLQILQLEGIYKKYEHFFLTFEERTTEKLRENEEVYFIKNPRRSFFDASISFLQTLIIFFKKKPNLIISTGAGVTVFICLLSKLFFKKVIFIESFSRVKYPSFTGRILYHISDLFIVQWKPLLKFYKNAVYGGLIF